MYDASLLISSASAGSGGASGGSSGGSASRDAGSGGASGGSSGGSASRDAGSDGASGGGSGGSASRDAGSESGDGDAQSSAVLTSVQANQENPTGSGTSFAVTLGSGVSAGDLVTVALAVGSNTTAVTPPDSSWAQAVVNHLAGPPNTSQLVEAGIWFLLVDAAHAGQTSWTFTLSQPHTCYIVIREWSSSTGWMTSPVDVAATGDVDPNLVQSTKVSSGTTATTAQAGELWVAALAYKGSAQVESFLTSGWTAGNESTLVGNNTLRECYQTASATGQALCQLTIGTAEYWAGAVATFKARP